MSNALVNRTTMPTIVTKNINWRLPWVIANWKMNPVEVTSVDALIKAIHKKLTDHKSIHCNIAVAPSFIHLTQVASLFCHTEAPLLLGAQNVCAYHAEKGAYTGEVSAMQLMDIGVKQVIIGHSERRQYFAEDNDVLAKKIACALQANLDIVFCVGETEAEYDKGETKAIIASQLSVLEEFTTHFLQSDDNGHTSRLIVAYEPVWAIGTGKVPTVDEVNLVHQAIEDYLVQLNPSLQSTPILYGGSVKADNASEFASSSHIDGVLVGGASLDADSFYQIITAFSKK